MDRLFSRIAGRSSWLLGHPLAFTVAVLATLAWAATGSAFSYSDTWQLVINTSTTILTFLAVFLIQNSQNRDGKAIQAKLDELIHVTKEARDDLVRAEDRTESEIEALRG